MDVKLLLDIVVKLVQRTYSRNLNHLGAGVVTLLTRVLITKHIQRPAKSRVIQLAPEATLNIGVVHIGVIAADIELRDVTFSPVFAVVLAQKLGQSVPRAVRAFPLLTRPVVVDKRFCHRRI